MSLGLFHLTHILFFNILDQLGMILTVYTLNLFILSYNIDLSNIINYLVIIVPLIIVFIYYIFYKFAMKYANLRRKQNIYKNMGELYTNISTKYLHKYKEYIYIYVYIENI